MECGGGFSAVAPWMGRMRCGGGVLGLVVADKEGRTKGVGIFLRGFGLLDSNRFRPRIRK